MPSLSQLVRNRATVEIPAAGDEPLRIEYMPAAITPRLMSQLETFDGLSVDERLSAMTGYLVAVVARWNLNRADGSVIPITREALADEVDYEAQKIIFRAILDDMNLGEAPGANSETPSSSTSSRKARRATSRR